MALCNLASVPQKFLVEVAPKAEVLTEEALRKSKRHT